MTIGARTCQFNFEIRVLSRVQRVCRRTELRIAIDDGGASDRQFWQSGIQIDPEPAVRGIRVIGIKVRDVGV